MAMGRAQAQPRAAFGGRGQAERAFSRVFIFRPMLGEGRVGTSGFAYREWVGYVYPPDATAAQLLPLYAQRLSAVEMSLLPPELVEPWAAAVPPGFQFAVKAPGRVATELATGKGAAHAWNAFLDVAEKLGDALGPILIQVPHSRSADRHALASFLTSLPDGLRIAFEFKHPSWHNDATLRMLSAREAGLVLTDDGEGLPRIELTAGFTYVRIRRDDDRPDIIEAWAERLGLLTRRGIDVYAFLKHDRKGLAVDRAMRLASLQRAESQYGEHAMLS
jgi:uncharacterized protein YecE (DUF72 family)